MFPLTRIRLLNFAAAATLVAITATSAPARSDDLAANLGPVGPHEPILTTVGTKHVIAFYLPGDDRCAVHMIIGDTTDPSAATAARIRIELEPGEIIHLDAIEQKVNPKSLNLECGYNAEKLASVNNDELVAFGAEQVEQPIRASVSGF
jgi:hypothetical protein